MATRLTSPGYSSCSRKQRAGGRSAHEPTDVALLKMTVDPQALFRRKVSVISQSRENPVIDDVFRSLLSEANRKLASLLRDGRTEPRGILLGEARSQQVSELLMRAVRCAAKQYMLQAELGNLALTDELTGWYNRRGFMAVAERQIRFGRRTGRGSSVLNLDTPCRF
jgi:hypothetical protein